MTGEAEAGGDWRRRYPWAADVIVCDGLLPWVKAMLPPGASLADLLGRYAASGFDHVSVTVAAGRDTALAALTRLGAIRAELADAPVRFVRDRADIRQAKADGVFSVAFHLQTATPFETSLDLVDAFHAAGVGRAILAYNEANRFADGCHEPRNAGLSAAGRALVGRMDAVGMVVDLSHCGERTSLDVLDMPLSQPPVFSHSNARALYEHERNITDEQIRRCAERGGTIGINGLGMFLGAGGPDIPRELARHAAHIAENAGADRVGLGLDYMYLEGSDYGFYHQASERWPRGYPPPPWEMFEPGQLGDLVGELLAIGFGEAEVSGILGDNYLALCA